MDPTIAGFEKGREALHQRMFGERASADPTRTEGIHSEWLDDHNVAPSVGETMTKTPRPALVVDIGETHGLTHRFIAGFSMQDLTCPSTRLATRRQPTRHFLCCAVCSSLGERSEPPKACAGAEKHGTQLRWWWRCCYFLL